MSTILLDVRYAGRMLAKNPGFAIVAVLALALGIGANTAIFSVVNAVLLRPLPFPTADRLVAIRVFKRSIPGPLSYPDFRDFRSQNHTLEHLAAYHDASWALTGRGREAANLNVLVASADLFQTLGVHPMMGRGFRSDEDDRVGASPMGVVLSYNAWQKYFGGDRNVVGKPVTLRARPYTVLGVMPASLQFPMRADAIDAWTTFAFSEDMQTATGEKGLAEQRGSHYLDGVAALRPGVNVSQANADLAVISTSLATQYPRSNKYRTAATEPLLDSLVQNFRATFLILLAAVGCVLLVACANVANLLLARATSRHREIAIRTALGAGRFRVARQVLTESIFLSLLGGCGGLILAAWLSDLLVRFGPQEIPRMASASLDFRVFVFAFLVSVATGVLFGTLPAWRVSASDPADALKEGMRGSTEGLRSNKARSALVVSEVALALMLLACAGLLMRSFLRLQNVPSGFTPERVLSAVISLPETSYRDADVDRYLDQVDRRLQTLPGVVAASDVVILPLAGNDMTTGIDTEGQTVSPVDRPESRINIVGANYFHTMGIPFRSGRDFNSRDNMQSPTVVVVNQAFASRFFPGQTAIGKHIRPGMGRGSATPFREIVGIVGDVEQDRIGKSALPEVFYPRTQFPNSYTALVIRTEGNPRNLIPGLRAAMRAIDPDVPLQDIQTMDERVAGSLAQPRFQSFLFGSFAAVALLLTAVGLYGVISYSVAQRTHEIGTRMAIGAKESSILRLIVGQGLLLTSLGVAIGLIGTLLAAQALRSVLFGIGPFDALTLAGVTLTVTAVSLLASYVPARRAAHVDPMIALRYE